MICLKLERYAPQLRARRRSNCVSRLNSGLLDDPVGGNSSGGAPEGGKRIGEWSQGVCGDMSTGTRTLLFALRTSPLSS